ncbi:hypothetical protein [Streptomyces sp. SID12488]|uniref:hypothetical protein n=1 Tax=Streptomyces sp. SID12488 TaxID=2706040 RepID=UPI0013DCDEB4|nr:hypothetical protein [Streptomyces sp. SID12488]NEA62333.1 hypothetical protein [Streptomyces sp. SID12488]
MSRRLWPPVPTGAAGGPAGGQDAFAPSPEGGRPTSSAVASPKVGVGQTPCAAAPGHPTGADTVGASAGAGAGGHSPALAPAGSAAGGPDTDASSDPAGPGPGPGPGPVGRKFGRGGGGGVV